MKEKTFLMRIRGNGRQNGLHADSSQSVVLCRVVQPSGYGHSPIPMCFTKRALCTLLDTVGARPPESGAMGFSPKDSMGFDLVEFDTHGSSNSGGAVYRPSVEWSEERQNHHLSLPDPQLRLWSGHLHSHPGAFGSPSGKAGKALGDLGYVEEVFAMNEWMQWFFIPILTSTGTDEIAINPWVCKRGNPVDLFIADLQVCRSASEFPLREFNPEWERRSEETSAVQATERDGTTEVGQTARVHEEEAKEMRPFVEQAPGAKQGASVQVQAADGSPDPEARQFAGEAPHRLPSVGQSAIRAYQGVSGAFAARSQRTEEKPSTKATPPAEVLEYTKRTRSVVSSAFRDKSILVVGVGAGSYAVEKLARLCPRQIKVCDFDIVELSNLARTLYTVPDAQKSNLKVQALQQRLGLINPWVEVISYPFNVTEMNGKQLIEMLQGVDLVFAGTDDFTAQALINKETFARGIPAVFIGIHAGAEGGRIVWQVPGLTPCYRCVAKDRFEEFDRNDAQLVNLAAAAGSIFDCQFIDMVATKVGVAILERGQDSAMGRFFRTMKRRNDVVVRCDPDYEWGQALWGAILGDLPREPKDFAKELNEQAFLAMDTIWLQSSWDPQCPVCHGGRIQNTAGDRRALS